jgi:hypothetical protein
MTTPTTTSAERRAASEARDAVATARSGFADTMDAVRSTATNVSDRMPDVIESVKVSASDGAKTVQAWPASSQRLAAAFSVGLGVGLTLAGAPRLVIAGSLLPAIVVAAANIGIERTDGAA